MKKRLILLAGIGIGFVLGSRAGRQSYENLKRQATNLWNDPKVQSGIETARETIEKKAPVVADAVKEKAPVVAEKVKEVADSSVAKAKDVAGKAKAKASGESAGADAGDATAITAKVGEGAEGATTSAKEHPNATLPHDTVSDPETEMDSEGPAYKK